MAIKVIIKYAGIVPISELRSEYHGNENQIDAASHTREKISEATNFAFIEKYKAA